LLTRDQWEESITQKSDSTINNVLQSDVIVDAKESCVNPLGQDTETGDSNKCDLYVNDTPPRLVALGRVYEGSTTVHNVPLGNDQVMVSVEEV